MRFLRPLVKQAIVTTVLGFVIHKLMASDDARARRVGERANKLVGSAFGPDTHAMPKPRSRRGRAVRSAATAAAGGVVSYFFDPAQGADRRAKAKRFATEHMHRNGERTLLPPVRTTDTVPVPSQAVAPGVPS